MITVKRANTAESKLNETLSVASFQYGNKNLNILPMFFIQNKCVLQD